MGEKRRALLRYGFADQKVHMYRHRLFRQTCVGSPDETSPERDAAGAVTEVPMLVTTRKSRLPT